MSENRLFLSSEENESDLESTCKSGSPPKVNHFYRGSPHARVCQVWPKSVSAFVSNPVYRMTKRMKE